MKVQLREAPNTEIVQTLFQYYLYDMSEYTGFSPDENGSYELPNAETILSDYWKEPEHYPYLIYVDDELAGFSLLRQYPFNDEYHDIGQFFVLRKFKKLGIGRKAFEMSVRKHRGKWITRVLPDNTGAFSFWRKVITAISSVPPKLVREKYYDKPMDFFYYEVE